MPRKNAKRPQSLLDLSDRRLIALAGERSFKRGQAYAAEDRVEIESCNVQAVTATVSGTEDYSVGLEFADGDLECNCECLAFEDDGFCKHLVAAVIVARGLIRSGATLKPAGDDLSPGNLGSFLRGQPAERLAAWLLELAETDAEVEQRLRLRQSQGDAGALRKQLGSLLRKRAFLDWRESTDFARRLDGAIESITEVVETDAERGAELCEFALARLLPIYEQSDDSHGAIGDRLKTLVELHVHSLAGLNAGANGLAARLLALQRLDDWGLFPLSSYWTRLGAGGQRKYAALVRADYEALPSPGARGDRDSRWGRDFPVVHRMEALAAQLNDTDLLVAVVSRDLSNGYAYARLAKICRDAGRDIDALDWLERGYRHHPDWGDMRVLLADEYRRAGRLDESVALHWEEFQHGPGPESWQRLKLADRRRWPEYRRRAIAHVEDAEVRHANGRRDVSLRVQLLLADRDIDAARVLGECEVAAPAVLEQLARSVARTHPVAAAGFLRRVVEATLPRTDAKHYASVVAQIREVQSLQPDAATDAWIADLKARYRSRRKLIALLNA